MAAQVPPDLLEDQALTGAPTPLDTIWRRFVSTRGLMTITPNAITVRLNNRTYSPVLRTAPLPPTQIPWWNGRTLTFEIGQPAPT